MVGLSATSWGCHGSTSVGVRARFDREGRPQAPSAFAPVKGVRVTAASADRVGVQRWVGSFGDRSGAPDRREPGPSGDSGLQRRREGVAAPSVQASVPVTGIRFGQCTLWSAGSRARYSSGES